MSEKLRYDPFGNQLHTGEGFRNKDHLYVYRYKDSTGKRCSIYAKDIYELRSKERDLLGIMKSISDVYNRGIITLNEAFDFYMGTKKSLRKTTSDNYHYTFDHFVRDRFGKKIVNQYKRTDILFFYRSLYDNRISIGTLDNIQTLIYPTFQMLVDDGILSFNPANNALKEFRKNHNLHHGIRHALTVEQETAFLDYVRNAPECALWRNLLIILFGTGMRIGECLGLLWDNIDFEERTITIDHSIVTLRESTVGCPYHISEPKTESGIRTIPMIDEVYNAFLDEYRRQEEAGWSNIAVEGITGFIFINKEDRLMNKQNVNRAIERIRIACNEYSLRSKDRKPVIIPHFSSHHIRHTFCSRLCENECNIKVIQSIMGQTDIRTTMEVYSEVSTRRLKESLKEHQEKLM